MTTDVRRLDLSVSDLELPAGFQLPDWSAPLDTDACLARIPEDATVKGMFFTATLEDVRSRGYTPPSHERFVAFKDYPMRRSFELLVECARLSHPDQPIREGLRRLTRPAYSTFAETVIGRAVFGVVGRNPSSIYKLSSRAWRHGASHGKLDVEILDDCTVLVRGSDFYLPAPVGVGIAEGVLEVCRRAGTVAVRREGPSALDLWIRWT